MNCKSVFKPPYPASRTHNRGATLKKPIAKLDLKTLFFLALSFAAIAAVNSWGCSSSTSTKEVKTPYVSLTGDVAVEVGSAIKLTAKTTFADDASYTWTSSDNAVATVGTDGTVTGVAKGEVVISAKGNTSAATGSWGVYVYEKPKTASKISISGKVAIKVGETAKLTAATIGAADASYAWDSADKTKATVAADGTVTGVAKGEVKITATGATTKEVGEWMMYVYEDVVQLPFVSVSGDVAAEVGKTIKLTAKTVYGVDSSYTWTTSDDKIASVANDGTVTAAAKGQVVITATGDSTKASGTWGVYVWEKPPVVSKVTVSGGVAIKVGESTRLTAVTTGGTDSGYDWASADETIAAVDADGEVTAVAKGEVKITATGKDTKESGTWMIYVYEDAPPIPAVVVEGSMALFVGGKVKFSAKTTNGTDSGYNWSSEDESIATVAEDGTVTGVAKGETVIYAEGKETKIKGERGVVVAVKHPEVPFEEQWASSGHADINAEAFKHWDNANPAVVPVGCAKCHSTTGFHDYLGVDGSAAGSVETAPAVGTVVSCTACHNSATKDMTSVTFASSGKTVSGLGHETACISCHQGVESKKSVDDYIAAAAVADDDAKSASLGFKNVHYMAAGAVQFGKTAQVGYEYAGKTYAAKFNHVEGVGSCNDCHNPHTLEVNVETCKTCHTDVATKDDLKKIRMVSSEKDFDGDGSATEGMAGEIEGLQAKLLAAIYAYAKDFNQAPIVYSPSAYPYWFVDTNADGVADPAETVNANKYKSWTARLVKATFNYQFSVKDPGAYAHNAAYVIELLYDSIADLNTKLVTPIDLSALNRDFAGHFDGAGEAWRHWDSNGIVPASCSKCHSADGLAYFNETGLTKDMPASLSMECSTCHDKPGDFSKRRTIKNIKFPSGLILDSGSNTTNMCATCHQGRESKVSVDAALAGLEADTVSSKIGFKNVHYFAAGATLFGTQAKGAYEYDGKHYEGKLVHWPGLNDCNSCHDVHTGEPKLTTCAQCHDGAATVEELKDIRSAGSLTDFDGDGDVSEGIYYEIEGLKQILYTAIRDYAKTIGGKEIKYDPNVYPYFMLDDGSGKSYNAWTPRLLKAAYNYQYATKDPGAFAHNPKYVIEIIYDSIEDLAEKVPVDYSLSHRNFAGHFDSNSEGWRHWDADGSVSSSCAKCHSPAGFEYYAQNLTNPTTSMPVSNGLQCSTCHDKTTFMPVYVGKITFPSAIAIDNDPSDSDNSFICMTCHTGRSAKKTVDDNIATANGDNSKLKFSNVHYAAAGATLYGSDAKVGYEYDGKAYAGKFEHTGSGSSSKCSFCHDMAGDSHTFKATFKESCEGCHASAGGDVEKIRKIAADVNGNGDNKEKLKDELAVLAEALLKQIQTVATANGKPIGYLESMNPYWFADTNGNGVIDVTSDPATNEAASSNSFKGWTPALVKAAFNYQFYLKERGAWAHNFKYIAELLIDSINDLGGDVSKYSRP